MRKSASDRLVIRLLSGNGVPNANLPSSCHSGKPQATRCLAISQAPQRDGWTYVVPPPDQNHRDGWWCPDCTRQLKELMARHKIRLTASGDTIVSRAGQA